MLYSTSKYSHKYARVFVIDLKNSTTNATISARIMQHELKKNKSKTRKKQDLKLASSFIDGGEDNFETQQWPRSPGIKG